MGARKKASLRMASVALSLVGAALYAPRASAHTIGLSTGEYRAKGSSVVGKLTFARGEVAALMPSIDANRDGHLTALEVDHARGMLESKLLARVVVTSAGARCAPALTDVGLTEQDGLVLAGRWDCPVSEAVSRASGASAPSDDVRSAATAFDVDVPLLDDLARGHRHLARSMTGSATNDEILYGERRTFSVVAESVAASSSERPAAGPAPRPASFWAFCAMGLEHIITGYDHLFFIVGLVLVRTRLRALLTVITAFTVSHSITLALAVLGVWAPSPHLIEPAIALSIAYVGVENVLVRDASRRWRIAFPFGLLHGFGFAGALREVDLPRSAVPKALLSFNLGVELGQLAVLALLLPIVVALRHKAWFEPQGRRVLSGAVALAGGIWFVARVFGG